LMAKGFGAPGRGWEPSTTRRLVRAVANVFPTLAFVLIVFAPLS